MSLSERQQNELEYHRDYAKKRNDIKNTDAPMDVMLDSRRRWWNGYWHTYTLLREMELKGKRVLVAGCGFGNDAIRIARQGAEVDACDLSPDVLELARIRAANFGVPAIRFDAMPLETMTYADNSFDVIIIIDILHHCDIPSAMNELNRVLRPGGAILGSELYTHGWMQVIRESWLVDKLIYRLLVKFIYGSKDPYITSDEHKINEHEFAVILSHIKQPRCDWFNFLIGRLVPDRFPAFAMIDRLFLRCAGSFGRLLAARVVFSGLVEK